MNKYIGLNLDVLFSICNESCKYDYYHGLLNNDLAIRFVPLIV